MRSHELCPALAKSGEFALWGCQAFKGGSRVDYSGDGLFTLLGAAGEKERERESDTDLDALGKREAIAA